MSDIKKQISVIGAGAWGTALAQVFAEAGNNIHLYARNNNLAENINSTHINDIYLPKVPLHQNLHATNNLTEAVARADILLLVTPTQFVRDLLVKIKPDISSKTLLVNCAKGIEISSGKILSEVTKEILPDNPYAVLSGPTFADEVGMGLPCAITLATKTKGTEAQNWAEALSSKSFRPYISHDPIGAEIAGALKNIIAIACGIVAGKKLGKNAHAAVMTRGMAEIRRLGLKKGAESETFLGLCGIGDLALTCHSMSSRNFSLGVALGEGKTLEEIMSTRHTVAEGASTTKAVFETSKELNIDMPISKAVYHVLYEQAHVGEIIQELLSRHLKTEGQ